MINNTYEKPKLKVFPLKCFTNIWRGVVVLSPILCRFFQWRFALSGYPLPTYIWQDIRSLITETIAGIVCLHFESRTERNFYTDESKTFSVLQILYSHRQEIYNILNKFLDLLKATLRNNIAELVFDNKKGSQKLSA